MNFEYYMRTDFTKSYNRLRQNIEVRTGQTTGSRPSRNPNASATPIPAMNRPAASQHKTGQTLTTITGAPGLPVPKERNQIDQLAAYSKYNSRIANIAMPYVLGYGLGGAAANPKAASERYFKDKSDRATNEQVLDPRTRIILFKMINRGLMEEVNGCVSTGKEVRALLEYTGLVPGV